MLVISTKQQTSFKKIEFQDDQGLSGASGSRAPGGPAPSCSNLSSSGFEKPSSSSGGPSGAAPRPRFAPEGAFDNCHAPSSAAPSSSADPTGPASGSSADAHPTAAASGSSADAHPTTAASGSSADAPPTGPAPGSPGDAPLNCPVPGAAAAVVPSGPHPTAGGLYTGEALLEALRDDPASNMLTSSSEAPWTVHMDQLVADTRTSVFSSQEVRFQR